MKISVIIRTRGDSERAALLPRAMNSIFTQAGVDVEVIVVLNGSQYDDTLLRSLERDSRIQTVVLDGPSLSRATEAGRALVTSEYFSFLDDDDEYLPGALALRVDYLNRHPQVDCVVTNGEYVSGSHTRPAVRDFEDRSRDLIASILNGRNWLPSCAGTFRASTVTKEYVERLPNTFEWTILAFRIASALNVSLIPESTYRIYATPGSESAGSEKYMRGAVDALLAIERWNQDPERARAIKRALATARHQLSSFYRINGDFERAWTLHWSSLRSELWWKYVPYTLVLSTRSRRNMASILTVSKRNQV